MIMRPIIKQQFLIKKNTKWWLFLFKDENQVEEMQISHNRGNSSEMAGGVVG